jgi:hypothetical protein
VCARGSIFTCPLVVRDSSVPLQTPAVTFCALKGGACRWTPVLEGMNAFLANLDVTFRRDERTGRPESTRPAHGRTVSRKPRASTTTRRPLIMTVSTGPLSTTARRKAGFQTRLRTCRRHPIKFNTVYGWCAGYRTQITCHRKLLVVVGSIHDVLATTLSLSDRCRIKMHKN